MEVCVHVCMWMQMHSLTLVNKQTKEIQKAKAQNSTHRDMLVHTYTLTHAHTDSKTHRPHSQTLAVCQKSVISCLEDVKAGFVTFVVTEAHLEKMINFCYLHYCPEGFSIGLTHFSFPPHCFSNGNEIECTASWVCLAETLLNREGTEKKTVFARNKTLLRHVNMAQQQPHRVFWLL